MIIRPSCFLTGTRGRIYMVANQYTNAKLKLDIRGIRVSAGEILFYTGLILWVTQEYINRTVFLNFFGGQFLTALRYFCMLIFFIKILVTEKKLKMKAAAVFIVSAAVFVVVQSHIDVGMPLIQVLLLVYAARSIPFKRICKVLLWSCLTLWLIPVLVDKLGICELPREVDKLRVREFLNFNYVSFGAIFFNNIVFCCLYAYTDPDLRGSGGNYAHRREVSWPVLAIFAAALIWLFKITDTSLPFLVGMLYMILYVLAIKLRVLRIRNTLPARLMAILIFPVLALVTYGIAAAYNWRVPWQKKLDDMIHYRFSLAHQGIQKHGIHLLGSAMQENTDRTKGAYFYVDSGYMKNLLNFGVIVFVLILIMYSIMLYAAIVEHDTMLAIWLICVAIYSIFNNMLLSPKENGSLFAIWYAIDLLHWHRKKKTAGLRAARMAARRRIEYGTQS